MTSITVPDEVAGSFNGELLADGDDGYDAARRIHNGLIDRRPGADRPLRQHRGCPRCDRTGQRLGCRDLGARAAATTWRGSRCATAA